ncbi:hypothetical protein Glove_117g209 [Diversispora epigaea]|uniref:TLDc domain-containing protein n=1 Tax=Diversispora epigaea TaxID=1348612 RepID=A0A397J0P2_9GLOM|nr:hypothetical protein Glove_117g209 [Diversispora epigaea]
MLVADDFELEELVTKIETFLIEAKALWLRKHISMIFLNIFDRKNFNDLLNFCNYNVEKYPSLIFEDLDFNSLSESALVSLLKRDDLQMKEVEIWHYVVKWGIAQNPTLPTNLGEWSNQNIITLKTTLQQCLPHIRYFQLSSDEVKDSIRPYKKILDKQLWKDINYHLSSPKRQIKSIILPARFILPPHVEEPKGLVSTIISEDHAEEISTMEISTIISEDHAAEISTWIDREETTYLTTNIPYKFELILSGSRDGFVPQTFWDICHGHASTILVMKVKEADEILGGYNPLAWDNSNINNKFMETKDSFIFSLKMYQNKHGPYFGLDFRMRGSNFALVNECYYGFYGNYYEKPITSLGKFSIVSYEVFKIVRKS